MSVLSKIVIIVAVAVVALFSINSEAQQKQIVLNESNTIVLNQQVSFMSVPSIIQKALDLESADSSSEPIYLVLDTPGGSVEAGLHLIQALQSIDRPVHTVTMFAASMGWQIAQALGDRLILSEGVMMSHKAQGVFGGEFGDGRSQLDNRIALWVERILQMDQATVRRTGGKQTLESYRSQYDNELWITANQAVKMGYADEIVRARCGNGLKGTRQDRISFMGAIILVTWSKCPLNVGPVSIEPLVRTVTGTTTLSDYLASPASVELAEGESVKNAMKIEEKYRQKLQKKLQLRRSEVVRMY